MRIDTELAEPLPLMNSASPGGKKHLTVGHRLFSVDWMRSVSKRCVKGVNSFFGCKDSLPVGDPRQRDALKFIGHHGLL